MLYNVRHKEGGDVVAERNRSYIVNARIGSGMIAATYHPGAFCIGGMNVKFEENDKSIDVTGYPETFVYFLTRRGEVVYVGQTKNGMARPLAHKYDKDFDGIHIMPCEENMLDFIENKYIVKYKPEYNKTISGAGYYSLMKARNTIRKICNQQNYSIRDLKQDCREVGAVPEVIDCVAYIKTEDVQKIIKLWM